jgi:hypothetical protein
VVSFLCIVSAPLVVTCVSPTEKVTREKRALSPPPAPGDPLVALPDKTTAWFNDHYGFRGRLMSLHGDIKYGALQASSEDVVVGEEGWLYVRADETLGDYTGSAPFDHRSLSRYARILDARSRFFKEESIGHLWAVVPNKVAIHPEFLPEAFRRTAGPGRLDQLLQHLRAETSLRVVDFREPLLAAKGPRFLYHRNDTHWNDWGVLTAYRHLCQALRPLLPGLEPLAEDQVVASSAVHEGDLSKLLGVGGGFLDTYEALDIRKPRARRVSQGPIVGLPERDVWGRKVELYAYEGPPRGPRLLMFVDSFATPLFRQLLASHFSRSLFVQASPALETIKLLVEQEDPEIVIEELAERHLGLLPADFPELKLPNRR